MIIGMWTRAPGGATWMQKRHVDSKWFFSDSTYGSVSAGASPPFSHVENVLVGWLVGWLD
jgi:hypothetical protein